MAMRESERKERAITWWLRFETTVVHKHPSKLLKIDVLSCSTTIFTQVDYYTTPSTFYPMWRKGLDSCCIIVQYLRSCYNKERQEEIKLLLFWSQMAQDHHLHF